MLNLQPLLAIVQSIIFLSSLTDFHTPPAKMPFGMPKAEILIDVGHGGIDGGTSHGKLLEKDINLQIANKLYINLKSKKYNVAINRISDYALSDDNRFKHFLPRHKRDLSQRKEIANQLEPKVMVSLHVNWSKRKSNSGAIVLYQKSEPSKELAGAVQDALNAYYQKENISFYGRKYYILNHSKCPAIIIEMGFISNSGDRLCLTNPKEQAKIADAIAKGIESYLARKTLAQSIVSSKTIREILPRL